MGLRRRGKDEHSRPFISPRRLNGGKQVVDRYLCTSLCMVTGRLAVPVINQKGLVN
jgi:hypothetical protein